MSVESIKNDIRSLFALGHKITTFWSDGAIAGSHHRFRFRDTLWVLKVKIPSIPFEIFIEVVVLPKDVDHAYYS